MQSLKTISLVTSVILAAIACARQNAGAGFDDGGDDMADVGGTSTSGTATGGTATGGTSSKAGTSSTLSVAGTTTSVGAAGKTSSSGGTGTDLPPAGSGGKTSGGSGGKAGSGSKAGSGGMTEAAGGADPDPVNMPIVGLSVTFMAADTSDPNDFIGGELHVVNDTAQPLPMADLKIRYYFSNEITAVMPSVMMNWAQFGKLSNLGGATCIGTINKAATPKPGADSYVELTCTGQSASELTAGMLLKVSWKAGAQGMGKLIQSDDWSFSDPTKIVVMNGNSIVWGVDP